MTSEREGSYLKLANARVVSNYLQGHLAIEGTEISVDLYGKVNVKVPRTATIPIFRFRGNEEVRGFYEMFKNGIDEVELYVNASPPHGVIPFFSFEDYDLGPEGVAVVEFLESLDVYVLKEQRGVRYHKRG